MSKYTKGPWEIKANAITLPEKGVIRAGDEVVAWYNGVDDGAGNRGKSGVGEVSEANARLIAAAPELLSSIKNLLKVVGTLDDGNGPSEEIHEAWMLVKTAISKAEGGK